MDIIHQQYTSHLFVDSAIMIEPTETESLETMDKFIDAMIIIAEEAKENPELLTLHHIIL